MNVSQNSLRIVFWCAALFFLVLNVLTIKDGHSWGDDFGQYIQHAKNIAQGQPYAGRIIAEPWVVVPPGYPLLLAPLLKCFGINFKILKLFNVVCWQLFVLALFPLLRRRLGEEAALLAALVLLSSPSFFIFKQNVLSDTAFIFFVTAALSAWTKYSESLKNEESKNARFFLGAALFFMLYSVLIRTAGVAVFIAAALYSFAAGNKKRDILLLILVFLMGMGISHIFGTSGMDHYMKSLQVPLEDLPKFFKEHVVYIFHTVVMFYIPTKNVVSIPIFSFLSFLITRTAPLLLVGIVLIFIYRLVRRTVSLVECFFFVYFLGIIVWTIEGGVRYFLPIAGPFLLLSLEGFRVGYQFVLRGKWEKAREGSIRWFLIFLIVNNCMSILIDIDFDDNEIYKKDAREMVQCVKDNVGSDEPYMFWKPRAMAALTDRVGAPFWIYPEEEKTWNRRVEKFKIDYLIIAKNDAFHLSERVSAGAVPAEAVWENSEYKIFKVKR